MFTYSDMFFCIFTAEWSGESPEIVLHMLNFRNYEIFLFLSLDYIFGLIPFRLKLY